MKYIFLGWGPGIRVGTLVPPFGANQYFVFFFYRKKKDAVCLA